MGEGEAREMSGPWERYQQAEESGPWDRYKEQQPASVTLGATLRDIPRQVGLTARYGLEGFGQTALPNILGLPEPRNANERVVGDASRVLVGALGFAKAGGLLSQAQQPVIAGVGRALAANTGGQAAGAIGAGLAGGSVREAGGGPTEQFIAAVLGGVAGGLSAPYMARGAAVAKGQAQRAFAPKDIAGELSVTLKRAGVDWDALDRQVQAGLVKDAARALYSGEAVDGAVAARLAHYRNIGATPTKGGITLNPRDVTLERNLSKTQANMAYSQGPDLSAIENDTARRVIGTLEGIERSPMDRTAAGQLVQSGIQQTDDAFRAAENTLYQQARESAGRDIPIDRSAFVEQAWANLAAKGKAPWLPAEVRSVLNTISKGKGQFTVDTIDNLKTTLAAESRKAGRAGDGNAKAAIAAVRDALESAQPLVQRNATGSTLPITGAQGSRLAAVDQAGDQLTADTLKKFDTARATARERRTWQESAKFIEDALDGQDPEKFIKRHVLNADLADLAKLRTEIRRDMTAVNAVRKQIVDYIMERGKADGEVVKFTSAGLEAAYKQIGRRKLALFFEPYEIQQMDSAIKVAKYSQAQPTGSAVNNSNSGAMIVGRALDSILKGTLKIPVIGPMVAEPVIGARVGMQARSAANVGNALLAPVERQPIPINPLLALALTPSGD